MVRHALRSWNSQEDEFRKLRTHPALSSCDPGAHGTSHLSRWERDGHQPDNVAKIGSLVPNSLQFMVFLFTLSLFTHTGSSCMSLRAQIACMLQSFSPTISSQPCGKAFSSGMAQCLAGLCSCTRPGCACAFLFSLSFWQRKISPPCRHMDVSRHDDPDRSL